MNLHLCLLAELTCNSASVKPGCFSSHRPSKACSAVPILGFAAWMVSCWCHASGSFISR
jgi:hypothetical protein